MSRFGDGKDEPVEPPKPFLRSGACFQADRHRREKRSCRASPRAQHGQQVGRRLEGPRVEFRQLEPEAARQDRSRRASSAVLRTHDHRDRALASVNPPRQPVDAGDMPPGAGTTVRHH